MEEKLVLRTERNKLDEMVPILLLLLHTTIVY